MNAARRRAGLWTTRFALFQILLLSATAVQAQQAQPERPYRGLFGQRDRDPKGRQPIDLTTSVSGGFDSSGGSVDSLTIGTAGPYSNVDTSLRIVRGRRNRLLTITGGDALRYYSGPDRLLATSYQGSLALTTPLWRSARLDMAQSVGYASFYQFELFPTLSLGDQSPKGLSSDYAVGSQSAYTYTSGILFEQKLGTRSELRLAYDRRSVMFSAGANDLLTQSGGIALTRHVTRYAGFHAGVVTRRGQYGLSGGANQLQTYDLDIGLDYGRPLSFSRRTTLKFSSGSSLIPRGGRTYHRFTGNASLTHQIARTWTASLRYDRALQFVDALPQPLLSDSFTAGVRGNPSRRLDLSLSGGYAAGGVGVSAEGGSFGTYTGSAQVGMSLNRHLALYSEYVFYHYSFGQQTLATALPGRLDRQTARVGLKLWFPLFD